MADKPAVSVDVTWKKGFTFTSNDEFGHTVTVAAPVSEGDEVEGMMPSGLLLTSLAGCSSIDVVSILQKQRQQLSGLEVKVTGKQNPEAPWPYEEIHLEYTLRGKGLNESFVERAIHLSETKYCSVGATLGKRAKITSSFTIIEE